MDNLRRVLVGLDPIPHEASIGDKAIADEFPESYLEGYDPSGKEMPDPDETVEREQATIDALTD
jgi:hypothetical protein